MQQRGFSIVELMIVVAVVGVMATFALPLYSDYMNRSKVAEPLTLLSGLKNPMVEYYMSMGEWPTVDKVGGKTTGRYTSIVESGGAINFNYEGGSKQGFYVQATMKAGTELGGKQIRMAYILETKDWICTLEGIDNPIPNKYLPSICR